MFPGAMSLRRSARTRRGAAFTWTALFVLSIGLQYAVATAPAPVIAASGLKAGTVAGFEVDGDLVGGNAASNPGSIPAALTAGLADAQDWIDGGGFGGLVDPADPPKSFIFRDAVDNPNSIAGDATPDTSAYVGGNKEDDTRNWGYFNSAGPNGKTDYRHVMAGVKVSGGNPFVFLGAERVDTSGTMVVDLELNQKPFKTWGDGVAKPDRSVNDLLISLEYSNGGSNPVVTLYRVSSIVSQNANGQVAAFSKIGDQATINAVRSATNFVALANTQFPPTPAGPAPAAYTVPAFAWAEASVNLAELNLPVTCLNFGQGSIRSRTGGSPDSSQLKDATKEFPLSVNTCAQVAIEKVDKGGQHLAGASFEISPNPLVGAPAGSTLAVTDNDAKDQDPRDGRILLGPCEPQVVYTVTETTAPAGYIKDPDAQSKTASAGDTVTFTFVNDLGSIRWQKNGPDGASKLGGATFTITPDPTDWTGVLTVVDNGPNDADADPGEFRVPGVRVDRAGGYEIAETVPPAGYIGTAVTVTVHPTSADPDVAVPAGTWVNTLGSIAWVKNGPDGSSLLGGATFTITPNPKTGSGTLTVVDNGAGDADPAAGEFLVGDARTGTYAVEETAAPSGYILDGTPANVTVSAAQPNRTIAAGTFVNHLGAIRWLKYGPDGQTLLGGATFRVSPDPTDGLGTLDVVDCVGIPCTGADRDETPGELELQGIPVGAYTITEIAAPAGYVLDPTPLNAEITSSLAAPYVVNAGSVTNTLGSIAWVKNGPDGSGLLGGATFTITPNPKTGSGTLTVVDNGASDADPDAGEFLVSGVRVDPAAPGYTIAETAAPAGYILDASTYAANPTTATPNVTVPAGTWINTLGSLRWEKRDGNGALLGGATFRVTGPGGFDVSVLDNAAADLDKDAGQFELGGLFLGAYTVTETAAPAGYVMDTTPRNATLTQGSPDVEISDDFVNPLGSLAWVKHDGEGNLLGGATFLVTGPFGYSQSVTDNAGLDADPTAGELLLEDLKLGTYTVAETAAPAGYLGSPVQLQGTLTQEAPDATLGVPFVNTLGEISWTKDKGDAGATPLGGATFSVTLNPYTGSGSLTVVDNDTHDADARDGFFRLVDVPTGTYTIAETAAPEGYARDTATCHVTVNAANPEGDTVCAFSNPPIPPAIDVVKTAGTSDVDQAADGATLEVEALPLNVTYKYVVTNSGDVRLVNVTVVDDNGTPANDADDFAASCEDGDGIGIAQPFELAAGASVTCFAVMSVTRDTTNVVTAAGESVGEGTPVSATDDAVVEIVGPAVSIVKTAGASAGSQAADGATYETEVFPGNVTYSYLVTNTGTTALNAIALVDDKLGSITCPQATLGVGASMTCTATTTLSTDTVNTGTVTATSPAGQPASDNDSAEVVILTPAISIVKTAGTAADGDPFPTNGGDVLYTYVVENTGEVDLFDVTVVDDRGTASTADDVTLSICTKGGQAQAAPFSLAVGEHMTCTATIAVDADTTNVATATGDTPHATVTDTDDAVVLVRRVTIEKSNDTTGPVAPGTTVGYVITLGVVNGPIPSLTVVDELPDNFGTPSNISDGGTYDDALNTITWELDDVVDGATLTYDVAIATTTQGGDYVNTATITEGPCVELCDDDSTVPVQRMSIQKTNDTEGPVAPGTTVGYTLTLAVQNGPIAAATVEDVLPASFGTPSNISDGGTYAAANRTITWNLLDVTDGDTLTYDVVIALATQGGDYVNTATITDGPCVATECDDDSTVPVWRMAILKANDADGTKSAGDLVSYTLTLAVQNGPIPSVTVVDDLPADFGIPSNISDGGVYDDQANTITWTLTDVADGATLTYDVTIGATTDAGQYVNVATITVGPCIGDECDDDSTVTVDEPQPATLVVKKLFDLDGKLATKDDQLPAAAWSFTTAIENGSISATSGTTGADGMVTFTVDVPSNGQTSLVDVTEVMQKDFKILAASCVMGEESRGTSSGLTMGSVAVYQGETVTCTFINTTGDVKQATPRVTPPPTDTESIPASDASGNVLLVLLAIVGLVAVLGVLTPAPARASRRGRRG